MNTRHKARKPISIAPRQTVTKYGAKLSWNIRHDDATPEQRAKAMRDIELRFAKREML